MDISKWGFQNRNLVYFLVAVLLAGGALACYQMSKLEDPEIKVKLAMVATTYPGASAHQVELEVTDVLEKNIRSMGNIDNVESYSCFLASAGERPCSISSTIFLAISCS